MARLPDIPIDLWGSYEADRFEQGVAATNAVHDLDKQWASPQYDVPMGPSPEELAELRRQIEEEERRKQEEERVRQIEAQLRAEQQRAEIDAEMARQQQMAANTDTSWMEEVYGSGRDSATSWGEDPQATQATDWGTTPQAEEAPKEEESEVDKFLRMSGETLSHWFYGDEKPPTEDAQPHYAELGRPSTEQPAADAYPTYPELGQPQAYEGAYPTYPELGQPQAYEGAYPSYPELGQASRTAPIPGEEPVSPSEPEGGWLDNLFGPRKDFGPESIAAKLEERNARGTDPRDPEGPIMRAGVRGAEIVGKAFQEAGEYLGDTERVAEDAKNAAIYAARNKLLHPGKPLGPIGAYEIASAVTENPVGKAISVAGDIPQQYVTDALEEAGVPGHKEFGFKLGPLEVGPREVIGAFAAPDLLPIPTGGASKAIRPGARALREAGEGVGRALREAGEFDPIRRMLSRADEPTTPRSPRAQTEYWDPREGGFDPEAAWAEQLQTRGRVEARSQSPDTFDPEAAWAEQLQTRGRVEARSQPPDTFDPEVAWQQQLEARRNVQDRWEENQLNLYDRRASGLGDNTMEQHAQPVDVNGRVLHPRVKISGDLTENLRGADIGNEVDEIVFAYEVNSEAFQDLYSRTWMGTLNDGLRTTADEIAQVLREQNPTLENPPVNFRGLIDGGVFGVLKHVPGGGGDYRLNPFGLLRAAAVAAKERNVAWESEEMLGILRDKFLGVKAHEYAHGLSTAGHHPYHNDMAVEILDLLSARGLGENLKETFRRMRASGELDDLLDDTQTALRGGFMVRTAQEVETDALTRLWKAIQSGVDDDPIDAARPTTSGIPGDSPGARVPGGGYPDGGGVRPGDAAAALPGGGRVPDSGPGVGSLEPADAAGTLSRATDPGAAPDPATLADQLDARIAEAKARGETVNPRVEQAAQVLRTVPWGTTSARFGTPTAADAQEVADVANRLLDGAPPAARQPASPSVTQRQPAPEPASPSVTESQPASRLPDDDMPDLSDEAIDAVDEGPQRTHVRGLGSKADVPEDVEGVAREAQGIYREDRPRVTRAEVDELKRKAGLGDVSAEQRRIMASTPGADTAMTEAINDDAWVKITQVAKLLRDTQVEAEKLEPAEADRLKDTVYDMMDAVLNSPEVQAAFKNASEIGRQLRSLRDEDTLARAVDDRERLRNLGSNLDEVPRIIERYLNGESIKGSADEEVLKTIVRALSRIGSRGLVDELISEEFGAVKATMRGGNVQIAGRRASAEGLPPERVPIGEVANEAVHRRNEQALQRAIKAMGGAKRKQGETFLTQGRALMNRYLKSSGDPGVEDEWNGFLDSLLSYGDLGEQYRNILQGRVDNALTQRAERAAKEIADAEERSLSRMGRRGRPVDPTISAAVAPTAPRTAPDIERELVRALRGQPQAVRAQIRDAQAEGRSLLAALREDRAANLPAWQQYVTDLPNLGPMGEMLRDAMEIRGRSARPPSANAAQFAAEYKEFRKPLTDLIDHYLRRKAAGADQRELDSIRDGYNRLQDQMVADVIPESALPDPVFRDTNPNFLALQERAFMDKELDLDYRLERYNDMMAKTAPERAAKAAERLEYETERKNLQQAVSAYLKEFRKSNSDPAEIARLQAEYDRIRTRLGTGNPERRAASLLNKPLFDLQDRIAKAKQSAADASVKRDRRSVFQGQVRDEKARLNEWIRLATAVEAGTATADDARKLLTDIATIKDVGAQAAVRIEKQIRDKGLTDRLGEAARTRDPITGRTELDKVVAAAAAAINPNDPKTLIKFLETYEKGTWVDKWDEFQVANMLSSPSTLGLNTLSAGLSGATRLAWHLPVGYVMSKMPGGDNRSIKELGAAYSGLFGDMVVGMDAAYQVMKQGFTDSAGYRAATLNRYERIPREYLSRGKFGRLGQILHFVSTRPMAASDTFFSHMLYAPMIRAHAMRKAEKSGGALTYSQIMSNLVDHKDVADAARKITDYSMLRGDDKVISAALHALRPKGSADTKTKQMQLILGRGIMPFIATPYNFFKQGLEYSPIGMFKNTIQTVKSDAFHGWGMTAAESRKWQKEIGDDPAKRAAYFQERRTEAATRLAGGAALMTTAYTLLANEMLTGDFPSDLQERQEWQSKGIQPRSVKIGNRWVSYEGTPLALPFSIFANAAKSYNEHEKKVMVEGDDWTFATHVMGHAMAAFETTQSVIDQSILRSPAEILSFWSDKQISPESGASSFTASIVSRQVPMSGMQGFLTAMFDTFQRDVPPATDPDVGFGGAFKAKVASRIPIDITGLIGNRFELDPKQDPMGNQLKTNRGIGSPEKDAPIVDFLIDNGVGVPPIQRTISIGASDAEVRLTRDEQLRYQQLTGYYLDKYIPEAMADQRFKAFTPLQKKTALERYVGRIREQAKSDLIKEIGQDVVISRAYQGRGRAEREAELAPVR